MWQFIKFLLKLGLKKITFEKINLTHIVVALISTLGSLGLVALKNHLNEQEKIEKREKKIRAFEDSIVGIRKVYEEIHNLRQALGAHKIIILKAHDSGAVPSVAANNLRSSAVFETFIPPLTSKIQTWQNERVDLHYSKVLTNIFYSERGEMILNIEELEPGSKLRLIYESGKIKRSHVVSLYKSPEYFLYMSIVFLDDVEINSGSYYETLRQSKRRLQKIFSEELQNGEF